MVAPIRKCENECFLILPRPLTGVKMAHMPQVRPYRGVDATERLAQRRRQLLDAGLELLGAAGKDPAELAVRAICGQAGLGVRYFYESFTDKDHFVGAVFDSVNAEIAATTQAAVASAPPHEQARADQYLDKLKFTPA